MGSVTVLFALFVFAACIYASDGYRYHTFDFENGGFKEVFEREEFLRLLRFVALMVGGGILLLFGGLRSIRRDGKSLDGATESSSPARSVPARLDESD